MRYKFNNKIIEPSLYSVDNIIIEVNKGFIDFTGFTMDELLGKSLIEVGDMLRVNSQIFLEGIISKYSGYIFTKIFGAREVNISLSYGKVTNEKIYTFIEIQNSRLDDKLIFVEQTFIDNISGAAIYSVPDLILLKANQRYLSFMDSPFNKEQNSIGKSITAIVTGFAGSKAEVLWKTVARTEKNSYVKEFKTDAFVRCVTYWESFLTPIFKDKKMKYIFETSIDVTERVLQNQNIERHNKIIEQQKELEAIIENISDGISIFDDKGQYILFNKSARAVSTIFSEKTYMIGDRNNKCELYNIDGEKIDPENIPARRVLRGEKFKNMRMAVKFPHKTLQLDVSGTPIYDSDGKFTVGVLSSRDMTYYINNEEAIRSRYELMNRIIDTFNLPVVRISCPDLKIENINKKAFSIFKLLKPDVQSTSQVEGKKISDLIKTFKTIEYYQCINEVLKERKTKHLNRKAFMVNGNDVYWNIIFEPIIDLNGEMQEILILVVDITTEIESNIVMEKALKSQGEFLVNISHELKTPLNVIFSTAQLFDMYCTSGSLDERKNLIIKYIDSMKQNCYRLSKLINNIVDISKIEAGFFELNLSNNNIVEVVERIVTSVTNFTESKGLNIIFDTDIEEKIIACDPEKIERIVLNLISNAIKFSDAGDQIFVNIKDKNEFIEISIKDNGIGIEEKYFDMIFDRFKQVDKSLSRNAEGTGIGLSLVKSIVELHGGSIHVESEVEKGSKFVVMLPSKNVSHDNMLYDSHMKNKNESIQVELSDVYL